MNLRGPSKRSLRYFTEPNVVEKAFFNESLQNANCLLYRAILLLSSALKDIGFRSETLLDVLCAEIKDLSGFGLDSVTRFGGLTFAEGIQDYRLID